MMNQQHLTRTDVLWLQSLCRQLRSTFIDEAKLEIETKSDFDFVTQKDVAVQKKIEKALLARYPTFNFFGEESTKQVADFSQPTWILDPIDGTTNFIFHRRYSCISLALAVNDALVFGLIYDPYADECFWAQKGEGAFLNDKKLPLLSPVPLKRTLLIAGSGSSNKALAWEQMQLLREMQQEIIDIRVSGSSSLNLAYLAAGRGSLLISASMKPWDMAAGIVLILEAGGFVCDYHGREMSGLQTSSIIAGPKALVAWALKKVEAQKFTTKAIFKDLYPGKFAN